jgi:hypothetical protein
LTAISCHPAHTFTHSFFLIMLSKLALSSTVALALSAFVLAQGSPPPFDPAGAPHVGNGKGQQFIGGQCLSAADCASGCCAKPTGICSALGDQSEEGKQGCGFVSTTTPPTTPPAANGTTAAPNPAQPLLDKTKELVKEARLIPTVAERIALLENKEYEFDFNLPNTGIIATGAAGHSVTASSLNFAALVGTGMSMTIGFLGPCGLNTPHTHPRATELNYVVNGALRTGFLMENGARFVFNEAKAGSVSVFPAGAIHFEQNNGCENVTFVAAFNHEDAGVIAVAQRFFGLPPDIVGADLGGLTPEEVADIEAKIPNNIAFGADECLKRCGITRPTQPLSQRQPRNAGNALPAGFSSTPDPADLYPAGSPGAAGNGTGSVSGKLGGVSGKLGGSSALGGAVGSSIGGSPILIALIAINGAFVVGALVALVLWLKSRGSSRKADKRGRYVPPSEYKEGMVEHQEYYDPHSAGQ